MNGSNSQQNKKVIKNYKKLLTNKRGCGIIYSQGKTPDIDEEATEMKFYETYDYNTKRKYWWTQRYSEGRCAEIRKNDNGKFELLICEIYKSTHCELQEAMDEAEKYVGNHIVGIHEEKKGRWVERKNRSPYCSLCGAVGDGGNYCSHCGVKMIKGG